MNDEIEQKAREIAERISPYEGTNKGTYRRCANENCYKGALEALQQSRKEVEKYKPYYDAVIDHCLVSHLPERDTPYNTIHALCCFERELALDPAVSEEASALHNTIKELKAKCAALEETVAILKDELYTYSHFQMRDIDILIDQRKILRVREQALNKASKEV